MTNNFISPINHPESSLSGSTVQSMIDRAKELGLSYFSIADQSTLSCALETYRIAKDKNLKPIIGMEIFFKDNNCPITKGTPSDNIKYFKMAVHAMDQKAYQLLVKMISDSSRPTTMVGEVSVKLFNWNDLETISKYNTTVCTTDAEDIITKHLLVGQAQNSVKYYQKLKDLFQDRFYPTIVPLTQDKYWNSFVKVTLKSGTKVEIPYNDRVDVEEWVEYKKKDGGRWVKMNKPTASILHKFKSRKKRITHIYVGGIRSKVADEHMEIASTSVVTSFSLLPEDIQEKSNKLMYGLAKKFGDVDRLLINSYSFFSTKEDKIVQDMKLGEDRRVYQTQYMSSTEDVRDYLGSTLGLSEGEISKLVENSKRWASRFDSFELSYDYRLPEVDGSPQENLINIIKEKGRMKWTDPVYLKQFREELALLTENGVINLIPYFLPIGDIYKYYEDSGYLTGPARGSAAGFLISYLLGITHVDPIRYGLHSSRFLTVDRIQHGDFPDFDADLESRIPLVGEDGNSGYLFNRWGNKAAQVSTRTLLRLKSAILDANRFAHGKVEPEIAEFSKGLPPTPQGVSDEDFVFGYEDGSGSHVPGLLEKSDDLQKYAVERPEEWEMVKRALSLSRQNSRHACAFLISDRAIEDTIPIMEVGGVKRVAQFKAKECEKAGLIKYDFLVVSALKDIRLCVDYINKKNKDENKPGWFSHNGSHTYVWDLPEEEKVFEMLSRGETQTVFQLNSASSTPFVKKIKPQSILDCAVITSLVRPGPLDFVDPKTGRNMAEEYIERRWGRSKGDIPILDELLPETYGIICLQEQITKIAKDLAGMEVADAENVRIGVSKKKKKLIESLKPKFVEGATKKVDEETALKIWDMMETFARYGFNKSHAVSYSFISYACAFLMHHYPLEWWASVLSNASDKEIKEVFFKYVKDIVLPPDINTSTEEITIDYESGKIRDKLSMIVGLGEKVANKIIDGRPYKDLDDFVRKKVCGQVLAKKLAHVGVLDSLFGKVNGESESEKTIRKIEALEKAIKRIEFEDKILEYDEKIKKSSEDEGAVKRLTKNRESYIKKGPKEATVDPAYVALTKKRDYLIKKSIFPTMNLDLVGVLKGNSNTPVLYTEKGLYAMNKWNKENRVVDGSTLQKIDNTNVNQDTYFCTPGYVVSMEEFSYQNNTRKALKLMIDSSGYLSEKVIWPDYNTGELKYPESLGKGCIAYFFYSKKAGKPYTNIMDISVEEKAI